MMRGDMLWPDLMWAALVLGLCWWSPFGREECSDHAEDVRAEVSQRLTTSATHQELLHVRRDTVTQVGHPVEPIREDWGGWE